MSINRDIKTLGKDLTNESKGAGTGAVGQTKSILASARTPLYAVIGASDHAAKRAVAVRPRAIREAVRDVVTEAVSTARKTVRRYEKRGHMVVADLRRAPGFTRVLNGAENAVDRIEDTLEDLISDAQGELQDVRAGAGTTASRAKATVRRAGTRRSAARKPAGTKASPAASRATKSNSAKGAPARKATTTKATPTKRATVKRARRSATASK